MANSSVHPSDNLLHLDQQICFPLYAASNLLNRIYRPVLAEFNLTYPQYLVMLVLWQTRPLSVGELGRQLYLDSGTLTPLLKRLQHNGLITRQRDAQDERRVLIDLTSEGIALQQQAITIPYTLLERLNLTHEHLATLRDLVQQTVGMLSSRLDSNQPLPSTTLNKE